MDSVAIQRVAVFLFTEVIGCVYEDDILSIGISVAANNKKKKGQLYYFDHDSISYTLSFHKKTQDMIYYGLNLGIQSDP